MYFDVVSYDNHNIWKFCETAKIDVMTNFDLMIDLSHKIVLWNWPYVILNINDQLNIHKKIYQPSTLLLLWFLSILILVDVTQVYWPYPRYGANPVSSLPIALYIC